ncbi:MAG: TolC family protein [Paludibacteraceae bacterium]|nr:TolC family protein [Paludibacteraceae bacterium]
MNIIKSLSIGLLLLSAPCFSQVSDSTKIALSLQGAKEYALAYNRKIKTADYAVLKSEQAKWQAIATMLPHAEASLAYVNMCGYKMKMMGNDIPMNPNGTLTVQATIAVSGAQIMATRLSELSKSLAETNKDISELDIKNQITEAYLAVLLAEKSKELLLDSRNNLNRLAEATQKSVEVGILESTDADIIEVQVLSLDNSIRSLEQNIEIAYNSLRIILCANADTEIDLTQELDDLLDEDNIMQVLSTTYDVKNDYNIQLIDKNIELAKRQVQLNKWAYGPTLSAYYQYNNKTYFNKDAGFNMSNPHTVGATLSVPLFSSAERLSKVRQAKYDVLTAELAKDDAVDGLLMKEKTLRFLLQTSIESYRIQKKNVEVYQRIFDKSSQKYSEGVISSTDLITISNNLITAQNAYVSAMNDVLTAQTKLQYLLNTL